MTMRALLVGSGAKGLGHIVPIVAIAQALQLEDPTSNVHVVCGDAEAGFLRRYKIPCTIFRAPIPARPWTLFPALLHSWKFLSATQPDVVLGKGGSLSIPFCVLAKLRGIPVVLHESDAVMGRANQFLKPFANAVCYGAVTGNPLRKDVLTGSREEGLRITGLGGKRPILLVLGGSQGAKALNELVWARLQELLTLCDIVHITGQGKGVMVSTDEPMTPGYVQKEFADEELPHLYAITDLALSRAGAGTISELTAWGIPMILVPLEGIAQDHQLANANVACEDENATLLRQKDAEKNLLSMVAKKMHRRTTRPPRATEAARQVVETMLRCVAPPHEGI